MAVRLSGFSILTQANSKTTQSATCFIQGRYTKV